MPVESPKPTSIEELNPAWPDVNDKFSVQYEHTQGIKNALVTQFPSLGPNPVTITAEHLNSTISSDEDASVSGNITFSDIIYGLKWDMPTQATPCALNAVEVADPFTPGSPTITAVNCNAALLTINNPPAQGYSSGFYIYYDKNDIAPGSGFQIIDASNPASLDPRLVLGIFDAAHSLLADFKNQLYLQDTSANNGNPISLSDIWDRIKNLPVQP